MTNGWLRARWMWAGLIGLALAGGAESGVAQRGGGQPVQFTTSDGVTVFADLHRAPAGRDRALVMLFHQAGSGGRAEYADIAPRLLEAGFSLLVVDLRSGGGQFGGINRTVARRRGGDPGYCAVYPDLEGALRYAKTAGFRGRIIAWGSSYSAALAIQLAARHPEDLLGVLAFSPASGSPMEGCTPEPFADAVTVPVLALRPDNEMRSTRIRDQLEGFEELGFETFVAAAGVHGSSMLVEDRARGPVEPTWEVVLGFLDRIAGGRD